MVNETVQMVAGPGLRVTAARGRLRRSAELNVPDDVF
jgi:hypothetical protein